MADAYDDLLDQYEQKATLSDARGHLQWDQEVMMPEGGTPARSRQLSTLSALEHETITDESVEDALAEIDRSALDPAQQAAVREIERQHERAVAVPTDLVETISATSSDALPKWKEAREADDFETFAPSLSSLVDLNREYADHVAPDRDPYEVLFEEYEPYLGIDTAERILTRLREELVPLIDAVGESDADIPRPFEGTYDTDTQETLCRDVLDDLGYDWDRGRLDVAPHPFSSGTRFDARITTRFDESRVLDALSSTVHEFGHATYTLGLPDEHYGTPLGESRDLSVHESQSRLWENHVGRSLPFWQGFTPTVEDGLGVSGTPQEFYEAANTVHPENLIRVEADELTYHMHIVLRFEIERDLVRGDLDVADVPDVWNEKMEEYLGVRPDTDAEGCLQDIHWSHGAFGYFPTYTLGSVLAAQLDHHVRTDLDVDDLVREGEFDPIREWMGEQIHRHGCRYTTPELIEEATGEAFTADYFVEYASEKFGELYGV